MQPDDIWEAARSVYPTGGSAAAVQVFLERGEDIDVRAIQKHMSLRGIRCVVPQSRRRAAFSKQDFEDKGCVVSPKCTECPLVICRHDLDTNGYGLHLAVQRTLVAGTTNPTVLSLAHKLHVTTETVRAPRPRSARLNAMQLKKIGRLKGEGWTIRQISDEMELAHSTIQQAAQRVQKQTVA